MLVSIAWRNLWRNPRRTIIILVVVAGGLTGMLTMHAFVSGLAHRVLEGLTGSYLGHVQIHRVGYRERGGASLTVRDADLVLAAVRGTEGVAGASGRIYGLSHASIVRGEDGAVREGGGEDVATPIMALVGLEPDHEGQVTDLPTKVTKGRWFEREAEVIVGKGLAERHRIETGDAVLATAVDMSGAMRGPWAASEEVPRVVGVMRSGVGVYDDRVAFMPRAYLGKLLRMEDQVHEVVVRAEDPEKLPELVDAIRASIAEARAGSVDVAIPASRPLVVARAGDEGGGAAEPDAGGVEGSEGGSGAPEPVTVRLVGIEPRDAVRPRDGALTGRYIARSEDALLSKAVAAALGVAVDDRIVVDVPIDCGEDVAATECPPSQEPFVVAGIVEDDGLLRGRFALMSGAVLTGNIGALAPAAVSDLDEADRGAAAALTARLLGGAAAPDEVLPWNEIAPEAARMLAMYDVMPVIFFVIIFFAVALGIVNTMLMATFERTRELGLMRSLGMRPSKVVAMVLWESALLASTGIVAGLAVATPLLWHWETHGMNLGMQPVDYNGITVDPTLWPTLGAGQVLSAVLTIGLMTGLSGLWPALRAARLQPTEALRSD